LHPELYIFDIPGWLQGLLPAQVTIYSYGSLIAFGAIVSYFYTSWQAKKQLNVSEDTTRSLMIFIIISAIVGGRFFYFFEDPSYYFSEPSNMMKFTSSGFVFYGSLLFAIPTMLIFFRINKIPAMQMLDIMAVTACIIHFFGRLGCFSAGCCYGLPHDGFFSVVFTDPICKARPLDTPLYPTQLMSAGLIFSIMLVLIAIQKRKQFHGQLFIIYLMLYAVGRAIVETLRGDYKRGYIIEEWVTHSQLISMLVVIGALYFYFKLKVKKNTSTN